MTKTLAVQMGRHGITVNCIHPGTTRTERTPSLLAARATQLGVSPEEAERQDFSPDSPRGNAICRMVDACGGRVRHGVPGLGQGLGGLRRAGRGNRGGRADGILLSSDLNTHPKYVTLRAGGGGPFRSPSFGQGAVRKVLLFYAGRCAPACMGVAGQKELKGGEGNEGASDRRVGRSGPDPRAPVARQR